MLLWILFFCIITVVLLYDLGLFSKNNSDITEKSSLKLTIIYILISISFGLGIGVFLSAERMLEYFTGYLIEKTLSLDNIFVMNIIFGYFAIPLRFQHRVLFYGILGVIFLRGLLISLSSVILASFSWVLYIFAVFLVISGIKLLLKKQDGGSIENNWIVNIANKYFNVSKTVENESFIVKKQGKYFITPLLLSLLVIEFSDLIFALDSIPAIFAITQDMYIVYTSNIFAILGLRSMYFLLASTVKKFYYLKYSLSSILIFIGIKIFYNGFWGHIPPYVSLCIILSILIFGVVASNLIKSTTVK